MSDDTTTDTISTGVEEAATVEAARDLTPEPEKVESEDGKAGKEAAKYRRQLRDTEAERDALGEKVTALQRLAVETEARKHLRKPEALWAAGADLAGLLDENGLPDPVKVEAASNDAVQRLGLNTTPKPDPSQGKSSYSGPSAPSFSDAFKPSRR